MPSIHLPRPAPGTGKWWVIGSIGIGLGIAVATWLGLANSVGHVTWETTRYVVVDDGTTVVDFDVTRPVGATLTCTVRAQDAHFATVGSTSVEVEASTTATAHQQVRLKTTSRAVTGNVASCRADRS